MNILCKKIIGHAHLRNGYNSVSIIVSFQTDLIDYTAHTPLVMYFNFYLY